MINANSKPNYMHDNAGEYGNFLFSILNFEQSYLLDRCGILLSYFVPTLGNLPLNQGLARVMNMRYITATDPRLLIMSSQK